MFIALVFYRTLKAESSVIDAIQYSTLCGEKQNENTYNSSIKTSKGPLRGVVESQLCMERRLVASLLMCALLILSGKTP